ncbi:hypothetical protein Aduo_016144 [Ancylostoma duodenale]
MEANGESEDETCGDDHLGVREAMYVRTLADLHALAADVVTFEWHHHATATCQEIASKHKSIIMSITQTTTTSNSPIRAAATKRRCHS